jgi:hypothetical protein
MSLDYIRDHYRVPAVLEGRIKFTWPEHDGDRLATIVGADGPHLMVLFDDGVLGHLHPTWEIEYLPAEEVAR